jgi:hypothetical protein
MKDIVQIKKGIITAQLSVTIERINDSVYVGHIPSFDIPFTSPDEEKAREIATGLVNALFTKWLKTGNLTLFKEKLKEYKFFKHSQSHSAQFEHFVPNKSFQIQQELHVA